MKLIIIKLEYSITMMIIQWNRIHLGELIVI